MGPMAPKQGPHLRRHHALAWAVMPSSLMHVCAPVAMSARSCQGPVQGMFPGLSALTGLRLRYSRRKA